MNRTATPSFRVTGVDADAFAHLFGLTDDALARHRARRVVVDAKPGFPDRVAVADAEVGSTVLLVNHVHLPVDGPYRASHAIYVGERRAATCDVVDAVPDALRIRTLSLRAFDDGGTMVDADLVEGHEAEPAIRRLLDDPAVAYLHVHFAKRGCYACRVDRVPGAG